MYPRKRLPSSASSTCLNLNAFNSLVSLKQTMCSQTMITIDFRRNYWEEHKYINMPPPPPTYSSGVCVDRCVQTGTVQNCVALS